MNYSLIPNAAFTYQSFSRPLMWSVLYLKLPNCP